MVFDVEKINCIINQFNFFNDEERSLKMTTLKYVYSLNFERLCQVINLVENDKISLKQFLLLMYLMDISNEIVNFTDFQLSNIYENIDNPSYYFRNYGLKDTCTTSEISTSLATKNLYKLKESVQELIKTHKSFCNKMCEINRKIEVFTKDKKYGSIMREFMNKIQAIIETNKDLHKNFSEFNVDSITSTRCILGKIILNHVPNICYYIEFYEKANQYEKSIINSIEYAKNISNIDMNRDYSTFFINECIATPMQNITRYPLLIKTIINNINPDSPIINELKMSLEIYTNACSELNKYYSQKENYKIITWLDEFVKIPTKISNILIKDGENYIKNHWIDFSSNRLNLADKTLFNDDRVVLYQLICKNEASDKHIRLYITRDLFILLHFTNDCPNFIPFDIKKYKVNIFLYKKVYSLSNVKILCSNDDAKSLTIVTFNKNINLIADSRLERDFFAKQFESCSKQYINDKLQLIRSKFKVKPMSPVIVIINYVIVDWSKNFKPYLSLKLGSKSVELFSLTTNPLIFNEPIYMEMNKEGEILTIFLIDTYRQTLYNLGNCKINLSHLKEENNDLSLKYSEKIYSTGGSQMSIAKIRLSLNLVKNDQLIENHLYERLIEKLNQPSKNEVSNEIKDIQSIDSTNDHVDSMINSQTSDNDKNNSCDKNSN